MGIIVLTAQISWAGSGDPGGEITPPPTKGATALSSWWLNALNATNAVHLFSDRGKPVGSLSARPNGTTVASSPSGRYQGQVATSSGSRFTFYDARNRVAGKASVESDRMTLYNTRGAYSGRMVKQGNTIRYFDRTGKYLGKAVVDRLGNYSYYDTQGRPTAKIHR